MKWTTILLAAVTGSAAAASVDDLLKIQAKLPKCSVGCIASGATALGCNITDFECQCNNYEAIKDETAPCMVKAGCNLTEISTASSVVTDLCFNQLKTNTTSTATNTGVKSVQTGTKGSLGTPSSAPQSWLVSGVILAGIVAML
ncbi:unnamed protein product [Clonostachys byssicola]|uniref:CFEM domain-containing protein n=1 Tax=Clonostachys byssicola TaxID=160290 RepID=A0A9N9UMR6_9HYPO|nr:unnamed protein product [Clonostachys byssicola]